MSHPLIHAKSSARRFGGIPEDYLEIHDLLDSSKSAFPDNRHRALTHNNWFFFIVERIFGHEIELTCTKCGGDGTLGVDHDHYDHMNGFGDIPCKDCKTTGFKGTAMTRYICEQHVLEDFGGKYIPTVSDYLEGMEFAPWMNNGLEGCPSSHRKLEEDPIVSPSTQIMDGSAQSPRRIVGRKTTRIMRFD